jgi:CheY-like chemotaxis protein
MDTIKVLVIDDNKNHAEGLTELLNLSGFDATSVWNGADGIELAERLRVDAVVLDLDLPDMTGYEVCQRLRANPATTSVAVIFYTGSQPSATVARIADAFLTYPVGINEISVVVQGCVARRKKL